MNKFPEDFLWGASTSSHQVEGNNSRNNWWRWEQAGNTEPSGLACDHYNLFREDFRLAKELGHNAHRLGIEWSRLEKEEGVWDETEWDHYKKVLDELVELGIEPLVTLNHFTVPLWFADKGGWLNSDSSSLFARFAEKAVKELGSRTRYWITINEPNILALLSYYTGEWPPCGKDFEKALFVLRHMLKGHAEAYARMKERAGSTSGANPPVIGLAKAVTAFHPCSKRSVMDRISTQLRRKFHNHTLIDSMIRGWSLLPDMRREKLAARDALDFIGLNYYFRQFIRHADSFLDNPLGEVCSCSHHPEAGDLTDMGWEIYPEGLYEVVMEFRRYGKPVMITENGLATHDDSVREHYIRDHLRQLLRAMDNGAPVKGYLHWSLLDNFEWAEGYSKRFGLIGVDFDTRQRTVRDSAKYYSSVIRSGKV